MVLETLRALHARLRAAWSTVLTPADLQPDDPLLMEAQRRLESYETAIEDALARHADQPFLMVGALRDIERQLDGELDRLSRARTATPPS